MASFGTGRINPDDYESTSEYLDAAMNARIDDGADPEKEAFDRDMYEANGEEWEGQYGGSYGY